MKFKNETERQAHPQARLIPRDLWSSRFYRGLDDRILFLMQAEDNACLAYLEELPIHALPDNEEKNAFLAIILSHPQLSPDLLRQIATQLTLRDYDIFNTVVVLGRLDLMAVLEKKVPDNVRYMIATDNFYSFSQAAKYGHCNILEYLAKKAPNQVQNMITADSFCSFRLAAENGHRNILEFLAEKVPNQVPAMIAKELFYSFRYAAANGHRNILEYLTEKAPNQVPAMIVTCNYYSFRYAAGNGHRNILEFLIEKSPDKAQDMIAADNFYSFRWAAENGHRNVLEYLAEKAPNQVQAIIAANDNYSFRQAIDKKHQDVIDYLLLYPQVLAYAEFHVIEYGEWITPHITQQLNRMHQQKSTLEEQNPNAVFDVSNIEAQCGFYTLRHLIRRNDEASLDDIRFLLTIPSIKNLAHVSVLNGQRNELLHLALTLRNRSAAEILLNLPEVRLEAERNNYYRDEVQGGLDLRGLAQNRESSMTALTTGEQRRLQAALDNYKPTIEQEGMVPRLMTALKEELQERFEEKPAQIEIKRNGRISTLNLPLLWEEFARLDLTVEEKQKALNAYHQDINHTALRYLSKPNRWMHPYAGYVYISDDRQERWATFEEYQPLIALLYLAAKDEQIAPIDGFTLETRLNHFIHELALIGRAHNWDDTRVLCDKEHNPILDDNGNPRIEEFDNVQEGDRPSCFSGVKRRLFQSVQGHPLFKMLTPQILSDEIREFVRQHFQKVIPQNRPQNLKKAWDDLVLGEQEAIKTLAVLNISEEQQQQFLVHLGKKYGAQFIEDPENKKQVEKVFQLNNPENDCHAVSFGYIGIKQLIQDALSAPQEPNPQRPVQIHIATNTPEYKRGYYGPAERKSSRGSFFEHKNEDEESASDGPGYKPR